MSSAVATLDESDLRERIVGFMRHASTEITTHDEARIDELATLLAPQTVVYVAHTPKATLEDLVRVALRVQASGLRAAPHIVARRMPSAAALRAVLQQLRAADIDQALIIAGDRDAPEGPFANSLDLIDSGLLTDAGLRRIGFAGHPAGHPKVAPEPLWAALRTKQAFAQSTGLAAHIVTQFDFDPSGICEWVRELAVRGITLPVHVGVAGPTSLMRLLRFAMQCGVGASLQSAARNLRSTASLVGMATTPEQMIPQLLRAGAASELPQIELPHLFAFGGALATARWLRTVAAGDFQLRADGQLQLRS